MGEFGACRIVMPDDLEVFKAWVKVMHKNRSVQLSTDDILELHRTHAPRSLAHRGGGSKTASANKNRLYIGINHFYCEDVLRTGGTRPRAKLRDVSMHPEQADNRVIKSPLPSAPPAGRDAPAPASRLRKQVRTDGQVGTPGRAARADGATDGGGDGAASLLSPAGVAHGAARGAAVKELKRKETAKSDRDTAADLREEYSWDDPADKRRLDPRDVHGQGRFIGDFVAVLEWGQLCVRHERECGGDLTFRVQDMSQLGLAGHLKAGCSSGAACKCRDKLHFWSSKRNSVGGQDNFAVNDGFGAAEALAPGLRGHLVQALHVMMLKEPFRGVGHPEWKPPFEADSKRVATGTAGFIDTVVAPAVKLQCEAEFELVANRMVTDGRGGITADAGHSSQRDAKATLHVAADMVTGEVVHAAIGHDGTSASRELPQTEDAHTALNGCVPSPIPLFFSSSRCAYSRMNRAPNTFQSAREPSIGWYLRRQYNQPVLGSLLG